MTLLTRLVGVGFQIMLIANLGICLAFYVTLQNCTNHADFKKKVYASNSFFYFHDFHDIWFCYRFSCLYSVVNMDATKSDYQENDYELVIFFLQIKSIQHDQ